MASIIYNINSETFKDIVKNSNSFTEIVKKCGLTSIGGNFKTIKKRLIKENIDYNHIINKPKKIFKPTNKKLSKEEVLNLHFKEQSTLGRFNIKRYIKKFNLFSYNCSECNISDLWNNKLLSLQLDHINGINNDNRLENLRYLCPNCHSQTNTFAGRSSRLRNKRKIYYCDSCNIELKENRNSNKCKICYKLHRCYLKLKKLGLTKEVLTDEVNKFPYTVLGRKYGVTYATIKDWCKKYNISIPNRRGYWNRNPN